MRDDTDKEIDLTGVAESSAELVPPAKKVKKITKLLGDIFKASQTTQTPLEEIKSGLHRYQLEEPLDLESDPLKWWHNTTQLILTLLNFYAVFGHRWLQVYHLNEF